MLASACIDVDVFAWIVPLPAENNGISALLPESVEMLAKNITIPHSQTCPVVRRPSFAHIDNGLRP
jgi:hypothetical protein